MTGFQVASVHSIALRSATAAPYFAGPARQPPCGESFHCGASPTLGRDENHATGTQLERKLGIKAGHRVAVLGASEGFALEGATARTRARPLDVILAFFAERRALERRLPALRAAMDPGAGLWIAWPKRASGVPTDVTEDVVRELGLAAALLDNKCARSTPPGRPYGW